MNSVIKLYSPQSELSDVADEILDIRSNIKSLKIELRDKISLKIGATYELIINRGDLSRVRFWFIYLDFSLIRIPINHDDELKIQSLRSKKPFQIKLLDENNNCLAKGMFYRYKTRYRSANPKEWDSTFFPEKHKIYEQQIIADSDSHFTIVRQISNEHGSLETKKHLRYQNYESSIKKFYLHCLIKEAAKNSS
ncbi:hypothetical protein BpHYR1_019267 [Brachionus plicatilis]|uniref:Uncharacterized protein n=1 Tax=Brachionus plicatilis TaxID=10195 RepID=A0A3M7PFD6_BRAPC|nr:hypothetical protein BpHYR1_019267 [Brachionus plicatilis]